MKHSRSSAHYGIVGGLLGFTWLACNGSPTADPARTPASGDIDTSAGVGLGMAGAPATTPAETPRPATGAGGTPVGSEQTSDGIPLEGSDVNAPSTGSSAETPPIPSVPALDASAPPDPAQEERPATCPTTATVVPGETTQTLTVGGQSRSYLLHVPPGYTGETPVPVVFDFHGLGGNGAQQRNLSGWAAVADREGFMMVYPNGSSNAWNVGRCCPPAADQASMTSPSCEPSSSGSRPKPASTKGASTPRVARTAAA